MIKQVIIRGICTGLTAACVLVGIVYVAMEGASREVARQDAVAAYNCEHYGKAINKHYGREVCNG
jgi:hypothetical protein